MAKVKEKTYKRPKATKQAKPVFVAKPKPLFTIEEGVVLTILGIMVSFGLCVLELGGKL